MNYGRMEAHVGARPRGKGINQIGHAGRFMPEALGRPDYHELTYSGIQL